MLELSQFDEDDFVAIKPGDVRAQITLEQSLRLDIENVELSLEITNANGTRVHEFPLVLLSERSIAPESGWFSDTPGRTVYTTALSETAIESFKSMQQTVANKQIEDLSFNVRTRFTPVDEMPEQAQLSIAIRLSAESDYITLIDAAEISFDQ